MKCCFKFLQHTTYVAPLQDDKFHLNQTSFKIDIVIHRTVQLVPVSESSPTDRMQPLKETCPIDAIQY